MKPNDISVVIPTLNEAATLADAIRSAIAAGAGEVIVVDGGSEDETTRIAMECRATKIVRSIPGRGIQLNAGALMAEGQMLLFLHADNRLDEEALRQICSLEEPVWGAFRQRIDSDRTIFRIIEWGNAMRVKWWRTPFGDQAIFVRRDVFTDQGAFAEIVLMEDVEFSKRMRKIARPLLLDGPVTVSARRWETYGPIRQTLRNWLIQIGYALGARPETLRKRYR